MNIRNIPKNALLVSVVAVVSMLFSSTGVRAEELQKHDWYVTGSAMGLVAANGTGFVIHLNPAAVQGRSNFQGNMSRSLAVGQEGVLSVGTSQPQNGRLEVEYVDGSIDRQSIDVPGTHIVLNDTVKFRALFLNGILGVWDTKSARWWLGAGIGYGQTKFPDASSATSCGCLKPLTHDDLAFRVKLQGEREISANAALFAEAGYIKLTGGDTNTIPGVAYGSLHLTNLSVGIRSYF